MWILEILNGKDEYQIVSAKTLGAEIVTVGRKNDCDVSLPTDKSISRKHAEIRISAKGVKIVDLGSTFGTTVDNDMIPANVCVDLRDGSVIKFGNESTFVKLRNFHLRFCATRLEKSDKDRVKIMSRTLGAEIVKSVEESSHVLCSRFSATVKTLTAIVMNKPIITVEWVEHISNPSSKSVDFLSTAEYVLILVTIFYCLTSLAAIGRQQETCRFLLRT